MVRAKLARHQAMGTEAADPSLLAFRTPDIVEKRVQWVFGIDGIACSGTKSTTIFHTSYVRMDNSFVLAIKSELILPHGVQNILRRYTALPIYADQ